MTGQAWAGSRSSGKYSLRKLSLAAGLRILRTTTESSLTRVCCTTSLHPTARSISISPHDFINPVTWSFKLSVDSDPDPDPSTGDSKPDLESWPMGDPSSYCSPPSMRLANSSCHVGTPLRISSINNHTKRARRGENMARVSCNWHLYKRELQAHFFFFSNYI